MSLIQVQWAANECARQQSGELSVADLYYAYHVAELYWEHTDHQGVTPQHIRYVHNRVCPALKGYRNVPVYFRESGEVNRLTHYQITRQMEYLCEAYNHGDFTPAEFYHEFETIHPFEDGNGRVGAIYYALMTGTLNVPAEYAPESGERMTNLMEQQDMSEQYTRP